MSRVFTSRNIQVSFSSAVVAAGLRGSDRGTKVVIVHILDTFLNVGRDRIDNVLQLLITIFLCMSESSPNVPFDVHLVIARRRGRTALAVARRRARTQRRGIELRI